MEHPDEPARGIVYGLMASVFIIALAYLAIRGVFEKTPPVPVPADPHMVVEAINEPFTRFHDTELHVTCWAATGLGLACRSDLEIARQDSITLAWARTLQ